MIEQTEDYRVGAADVARRMHAAMSSHNYSRLSVEEKRALRRYGELVIAEYQQTLLDTLTGLKPRDAAVDGFAQRLREALQ